MSVKSFKFVSPGVFINEIDNSFIPRSAEEIGPVVIGRSRRGLGMQPIKVQSYSEYVTVFGDTVPGGGGGDIYRDGNYQSPMYGTYAAKAFLNANVAPLTYVRLLGQEAPGNDGDGGAAGWKTTNSTDLDIDSSGGAYGLFLVHSGASVNMHKTMLGAVWYVDKGYVGLSGSLRGGAAAILEPAGAASTTAGHGKVYGTNSDGTFTMLISGAQVAETKINFTLDDTKDNYIRNVLNTNPQLGNYNASDFYPATSEKIFWLGETYDQALREEGYLTASQAFVMPIQNSSKVGMHSQKHPSREAVAGWFIGQDLGDKSVYAPFNAAKLFRLKGRGHGEWLHKNCKVSIERVRASTSKTTDYGTFSVVIRDIRDNDNAVIVLERFDGCNLNPASPNFVGRKIGTKYLQWDNDQRRLKSYGDYDNESKYVYVEMDEDIENGAADPTLLPFGYYGPPVFSDLFDVNGTFHVATAQYSLQASGGANATTAYVTGGGDTIRNIGTVNSATAMTGAFFKAAQYWLSGGQGITQDAGATVVGGYIPLSASLFFPHNSLRLSASDGGLSDPTRAYFGLRTTRTAGSTAYDKSVASMQNVLYEDFPDDPVSAGYQGTAGINAWSYIFSLDDVVSGSTGFFYKSGSRAGATHQGRFDASAEGVYNSATTGAYTDLLDAGYDSFTAPFWGGFDGWDVMKPDPTYNAGMSATSTETNDYAYHTWKRAIDTVADPEALDMNLLSAPGLTLDKLTTHAVRVCEDRGDALAIIDLPDVYIPPHEAAKSTKADRIATTPTEAAKVLARREIDSSYGCTFYPWVQTRDDQTGQLLWIPPSVAVMGVLASSQAASEIWFAPAGFNRGGLTDGAAGIPISSVTERLTSKERDTLYESNINPIASFPSSGIVLFGQKTLQERQSALDRINVRRLVIYLKKQISILSTQILFEQNVTTTWNAFKALIEPLLASVKIRFGLSDYRLVLDESTTTPDLIDQNVLYAKIMVKPARAIEFIAIDFVIMSTGASFDD